VGRAGVCDSTRNVWLAEVGARPHGRIECAALAVAHVSPVSRPAVWRVGSLFAGARDALSAGFMDAGCAAESTFQFASESDPDKLLVLRMHRSPRHEYASAEEASARCPVSSPVVDALVASPPCDRVSRTRDNADDHAGPSCSTAADFETIHRCDGVLRAQPLLLLVVELSDGLASHQPSAYAAADRALRELPYAWSVKSRQVRHVNSVLVSRAM
jgi:hypothetical protein